MRPTGTAKRDCDHAGAAGMVLFELLSPLLCLRLWNSMDSCCLHSCERFSALISCVLPSRYFLGDILEFNKFTRHSFQAIVRDHEGIHRETGGGTVQNQACFQVCGENWCVRLDSTSTIDLLIVGTRKLETTH